jgi:glycosyltransferase involved in cell wall biosynthesis
VQPADFELWPGQLRAKKYRQAIGILLKVRSLLKQKNYDIIEFYGDEYWLLLWWLRKKKGRPLLVAHVDGIELHDMDKEQRFWNPRKGLSSWLYRNTHYRFSHLNFSFADRYVCGCQDDLDYVIEKKLFLPSEARCISPALDEAFHEIPFRSEKKEIILFLGSWIPRKGIQLIPRVISAVLRAHPSYEFHVFGAWNAKDEIISSFPSELRSKIRVFEKLPQEQLKKGILEASIFFFPSYSEGFGLATAEAMASSCAVVTTPTGIGSNLIPGIQAMISHFNDTTDMEMLIHSLIQDESKRLSIAKGGYDKVREYQWSVQIKRLEEAYTSWLLEWKK